MTRKDYVAIAKIIAETASAPDLRNSTSSLSKQWAAGCDAACERVASHFADYAAADNARFDRARFLAACGVQS